MEAAQGGAEVAGSLHSDMDHASATSFEPYPSAPGAGAQDGLGNGTEPMQPMQLDYQPTPANIKELQHGAASMVVDFPVPISSGH